MAVHLLHVFATFAAGGPQVRTARLIEGLGDDFRHSILAMDGETAARELLTDAVETRVLDSFPRGAAWPTLRRLRGLVSSEAPDLVTTYNWGSIEAVWAARSLGRPVLHHEDGFLPDELAGFKRRRVWARRLTLRGVKGVVVPSHTLETIARETWRLPERLVHLVPNGIRLERFPPADGNSALRAELEIPQDAFVVGSVGHLRPEKNPARLVRAVARMRTPAHLVLVGEGPERAACEAAGRAAGLGARLHLAGHQSETPPWYALMDAFAIGSDTEQMPVALLEALASRLPVVSTDVGDVARMVPEASRACIVPLGPEVEAELAAALDTLAGDRASRERLGSEGRRRVAERYAFDRMLATYRGLYAKSSSGNAGGSPRRVAG